MIAEVHSINAAAGAQLLTAEELAERWKVKKAHVYRVAREGVIPTERIGRYPRFKLAAIEAWEQDQARAAA